MSLGHNSLSGGGWRFEYLAIRLGSIISRYEFSSFVEVIIKQTALPGLDVILLEANYHDK
jgi:hypothetical protein